MFREHGLLVVAKKTTEFMIFLLLFTLPLTDLLFNIICIKYLQMHRGPILHGWPLGFETGGYGNWGKSSGVLICQTM